MEKSKVSFLKKILTSQNIVRPPINLRVSVLVKSMGKQKDAYPSPAFLHSVPVSLEASILTASIGDAMTVETTGQEVMRFDWSEDQPYNHTWE